jgi:hypothetical protein
MICACLDIHGHGLCKASEQGYHPNASHEARLGEAEHVRRIRPTEAGTNLQTLGQLSRLPLASACIG